MDRGVWWATVHGVRNSPMQLNDWARVHTKRMDKLINHFNYSGNRVGFLAWLKSPQKSHVLDNERGQARRAQGTVVPTGGQRTWQNDRWVWQPSQVTTSSVKHSRVRLHVPWVLLNPWPLLLDDQNFPGAEPLPWALTNKQKGESAPCGLHKGHGFGPLPWSMDPAGPCPLSQGARKRYLSLLVLKLSRDVWLASVDMVSREDGDCGTKGCPTGPCSLSICYEPLAKTYKIQRLI